MRGRPERAALERDRFVEVSQLNLFLGFAPFIVFAILMRLSVDLALWLAFAIAFTIGIRFFVRTREFRILDLGNIAMFGFLALFCGFVEPELGASAIRLIIDIGLFGIALASLAARQPFTLQYAREEVSPEVWASSAFIRANYVITLVWMSAFAVMSAADAAQAFQQVSGGLGATKTAHLWLSYAQSKSAPASAAAH